MEEVEMEEEKEIGEKEKTEEKGAGEREDRAGR